MKKVLIAAFAAGIMATAVNAQTAPAATKTQTSAQAKPVEKKSEMKPAEKKEVGATASASKAKHAHKVNAQHSAKPAADKK